MAITCRDGRRFKGASICVTESLLIITSRKLTEWPTALLRCFQEDSKQCNCPPWQLFKKCYIEVNEDQNSIRCFREVGQPCLQKPCDNASFNTSDNTSGAVAIACYTMPRSYTAKILNAASNITLFFRANLLIFLHQEEMFPKTAHPKIGAVVIVQVFQTPNAHCLFGSVCLGVF